MEVPLSALERSQGYEELSASMDVSKQNTYEGIFTPPAVIRDKEQIALSEKDRSCGYEELHAQENLKSQNCDGYEEVSDTETKNGYEDINDDSNGYELASEDESVLNTADIKAVYEREYDVALSLEDEPDKRYNVEPYFKPASKEEQVMMQLEDKLQVPIIPEENVKLFEELGSGEFGKVYKGLWSRAVKDCNALVEEEVAVKTIRGGVTEEEKVKFLQEAAKIAQFKHHYVICMRGIVLSPSNMMIVLELMKGGDLREYLLTTMRKKLKILDPLESGSILLSYTKQLALGMYCFARKSYIHRDFAARNFLMSEDGLTCKIADFGLSHDLQDKDFYVSTGGKIPVKWTAPEALLYRKYSTSSDVWSYGCVLYEIWSLGEKPFHTMTNQQAMKRVVAGFRLPPPPGCPRIVYDIMIKTWHPIPEERPTFCSIMQELQRPDIHMLRWSDKEMSSYSTAARTLGSPLEFGQQLYKDLQRTYIKVKN